MQNLHFCFEPFAAYEDAILVAASSPADAAAYDGACEGNTQTYTACCAIAPDQLHTSVYFCLACTTCSTRTCLLQIAGTHGTVRLDDFVIPYRPDKASFLVTNNHGFTELDLQVKTETEERVVS